MDAMGTVTAPFEKWLGFFGQDVFGILGKYIYICFRQLWLFFLKDGENLKDHPRTWIRDSSPMVIGFVPKGSARGTPDPKLRFHGL